MRAEFGEMMVVLRWHVIICITTNILRVIHPERFSYRIGATNRLTRQIGFVWQNSWLSVGTRGFKLSKPDAVEFLTAKGKGWMGGPGALVAWLAFNVVAVEAALEALLSALVAVDAALEAVEAALEASDAAELAALEALLASLAALEAIEPAVEAAELSPAVTAELAAEAALAAVDAALEA